MASLHIWSFEQHPLTIGSTTCKLVVPHLVRPSIKIFKSLASSTLFPFTIDPRSTSGRTQKSKLSIPLDILIVLPSFATITEYALLTYIPASHNSTRQQLPRWTGCVWNLSSRLRGCCHSLLFCGRLYLGCNPRSYSSSNHYSLQR